MSDIVNVAILAEATARFSKKVKMKKSDYERYLRICEEWQSGCEVDEQIKEIAVKYGFHGDGDDIENIDAPEGIEFELVK